MSIYALAGLVLIPTFGWIVGPSEIGDLTAYFLAAHFLSALALYVPATVTVHLLQAWIGPMPWRRLWLTGVLAVPVVWIGTLVGVQIANPFAEEMRRVLGWGTEILMVLGWAILFSNLLLLMTWVIPSRSRPERR